MASSTPHGKEISRTTRLGILLLVLGGLAAFDQFFDIPVFSRIWPLLILMPGLGFLGIYAQRGRREAVFLGTGTYLLCFSLLAFYCTFTSWDSLAFLWPLFIAFSGVTFFVIYFFHVHGRRRHILFLALVLSAVAVGFGIILSLGSQYWWSVLLLLGLSLLIVEKIHE